MDFSTAIRIIWAGGRDQYTAKLHATGIKNDIKAKHTGIGASISAYITNPDFNDRVKELTLKYLLKDSFFKNGFLTGQLKSLQAMIPKIVQTNREVKALEKQKLKTDASFVKALKTTKDNFENVVQVQKTFPKGEIPISFAAQFAAVHKPLKDRVGELNAKQDLVNEALLAKQHEFDNSVAEAKQAVQAFGVSAPWVEFWFKAELAHKKVTV